MTVVLHYVGGGAYFIGVPARDLTEDDLGELPDWTADVLVDSGLYEWAGGMN